MKKLLAILLSIALMLTFAACGDDKEILSDETQSKLDELKESVNNMDELTDAVSDATTTTPSWKAKLDEFEAFVDSYIGVMKSGGDTSAYDARGEQLTEELTTIGESLTGDEQLEFASEYLRITTKLTDAMDIDMNDLLDDESLDEALEDLEDLEGLDDLDLEDYGF